MDIHQACANVPPCYSHSDIDECSSANECHQNATCNNTKGSYNCTCKDGFEGDGKNCTGEVLFTTVFVDTQLSKTKHPASTLSLPRYYCSNKNHMVM